MSEQWIQPDECADRMMHLLNEKDATIANLTAERDALRDREAKAKAEIARLETTNLILQGIIVELNEQHAGK